MGISKEEVFIKFKELKLLASSKIWSECIYEEYWKIQYQESEQRRREDIDSMFGERDLVIGRLYTRGMEDGTSRTVKYEQALEDEIYKFSFVDSGETFEFDQFDVGYYLEEVE